MTSNMVQLQDIYTRITIEEVDYIGMKNRQSHEGTRLLESKSIRITDESDSIECVKKDVR